MEEQQNSVRSIVYYMVLGTSRFTNHKILTKVESCLGVAHISQSLCCSHQFIQRKSKGKQTSLASLNKKLLRLNELQKKKQKKKKPGRIRKPAKCPTKRSFGIVLGNNNVTSRTANVLVLCILLWRYLEFSEG